jgi:hypothetical protein
MINYKTRQHIGFKLTNIIRIKKSILKKNQIIIQELNVNIQILIINFFKEKNVNFINLKLTIV